MITAKAANQKGRSESVGFIYREREVCRYERSMYRQNLKTSFFVSKIKRNPICVVHARASLFKNAVDNAVLSVQHPVVDAGWVHEFRPRPFYHNDFFLGGQNEEIN